MMKKLMSLIIVMGVIFGMGLLASCKNNNSADLVVYGKIFTSEGNQIVEAFAVKDGKYVYVGDKAGAEAYVEEGKTEVIDYTGKGLVMPGCGNGHAHYSFGYAIQSVGTVMSRETDVDQFIKEIVPAAVKKAKDAGVNFVFGSGWEMMKFPKDLCYRKLLDEVCSDIPIYFFDEEGHKGIANTILLKKAGLIKEDGTAGKTEMRGGEIVLDADGVPTGYVKEQAGTYVRSFLDNDNLFSVDIAKENMPKIQEQLLSEGYTMYQDGYSSPFFNDSFYQAAQQMDQAGDMHFVLGTAWEMDSWMDVDKTLEKAADTKKYESTHIRTNWLKMFMDGTVESGTGFVDPLYADGHQGIPNWSEEELTDITRKANEKGITMHVHVMGNKGVERIVNAFINGGKDEMRNTLVHVYGVKEADYKRMADHNIYVTSGMLWHHADSTLQKELMKILPEGMKDKGYPMKSFLDHGINLSSHSDFPALCGAPDDPFGIMEIVVTGVYYPENAKPWWTEECLTREQALQTLTINVARQMFLENERGSISVGKYADFLLVNKDVLTCPVTEIHEAKPAATYFEGKQVFKLSEAPDYSDKNNWMKLPEATKDVDCFYIYPTEYADDSENASTFADINEKMMRETAPQTYLVQGTAFEDVANVFAPYYRQVNMAVATSMSSEEMQNAFASTPKDDIFAALDYYFENLNGGRPFILAGHSQGSAMQKLVLAEYMKAHPEYYKRMIAAYVIGFAVTEDYLKENPHLKFAEGAEDTGVIISWNTESPANEGQKNGVVLPGAISINPINWKRDETYAPAEENLGGYYYNEEKGQMEKVPHVADAKVNLKRGTVITTVKDVPPVTGTDFFGPGSFHEVDYELYFFNIKANVAERVAAYKKNASGI